MTFTTRNTLVPALTLMAVLTASGCASITGPRQLAAAEGITLTDASPAARRGWPRQQCATQVRDDSLQAARCARAELMRSVGPAAPALAF